MNKSEHWSNTYKNSLPEELSWYQPSPTLSLTLIEAMRLEKQDRVIDVGAGTSKLCQMLLDDGYKNLEALDISAQAIAIQKQKMGADAEKIIWHESDVLDFNSSNNYTLWHDRGCFHFLLEKEKRKNYVAILDAHTHQGANIIVSTIKKDSHKEFCSGMPLKQFDDTMIQQEFGEGYQLIDAIVEEHEAPWGVKQDYVYFHFLKV